MTGHLIGGALVLAGLALWVWGKARYRHRRRVATLQQHLSFVDLVDVSAYPCPCGAGPGEPHRETAATAVAADDYANGGKRRER